MVSVCSRSASIRLFNVSKDFSIVGRTHLGAEVPPAISFHKSDQSVEFFLIIDVPFMKEPRAAGWPEFLR